MLTYADVCTGHQPLGALAFLVLAQRLDDAVNLLVTYADLC
jgi:hypothetical protein